MIYIEYIKLNGKPIRLSSRPIKASNPSRAILAFSGDVDALLELPFRIKAGSVEIIGKHENPNMSFNYDLGEWKDVRGEPEKIASAILEARNQRNAMLAQSDWTQVPDAPVDKAAWAIYRQELRDITKQSGFPLEVIWPNKPQ